MASLRNVYVVDEDNERRRELAAFHRARGLAPTTFASVESFIKSARDLEPGCVILGSVPPVAVPDVVAAIGDNPEPLPVIMFAVAGNVASTVKAMKRPAKKILELPFDENSAYDVLNWLFTDLGRDLSLTVEMVEAEKLVRGLTDRELDVLRGLAGGLANKAIASELGITARTVEMHRAKMMLRLNVKTLSAALRIAFYAKIAPLVPGEDHTRTLVLVPTA